MIKTVKQLFSGKQKTGSHLFVILSFFYFILQLIGKAPRQLGIYTEFSQILVLYAHYFWAAILFWGLAILSWNKDKTKLRDKLIIGGVSLIGICFMVLPYFQGIEKPLSQHFLFNKSGVFFLLLIPWLLFQVYSRIYHRYFQQPTASWFLLAFTILAIGLAYFEYLALYYNFFGK